MNITELIKELDVLARRENKEYTYRIGAKHGKILIKNKPITEYMFLVKDEDNRTVFESMGNSVEDVVEKMANKIKNL